MKYSKGRETNQKNLIRIKGFKHGLRIILIHMFSRFSLLEQGICIRCSVSFSPFNQRRELWSLLTLPSLFSFTLPLMYPKMIKIEFNQSSLRNFNRIPFRFDDLNK